MGGWRAAEIPRIAAFASGFGNTPGTDSQAHQRIQAQGGGDRSDQQPGEHWQFDGSELDAAAAGGFFEDEPNHGIFHQPHFGRRGFGGDGAGYVIADGYLAAAAGY